MHLRICAISAYGHDHRSHSTITLSHRHSATRLKAGIQRKPSALGAVHVADWSIRKRFAYCIRRKYDKYYRVPREVNTIRKNKPAEESKQALVRCSRLLAKLDDKQQVHL